MEIKVGQWVRLKGSNKIKKVLEDERFGLIIDPIGIPLLEKFVIAVADDPRELVEVGDMIKFIFPHNLDLLLFGMVNEVDKNFIHTRLGTINRNKIIEIWTRTSENTYTKQWEAK